MKILLLFVAAALCAQDKPLHVDNFVGLALRYDWHATNQASSMSCLDLISSGTLTYTTPRFVCIDFRGQVHFGPGFGPLSAARLVSYWVSTFKAPCGPGTTRLAIDVWAKDYPVVEVAMDGTPAYYVPIVQTADTRAFWRELRKVMHDPCRVLKVGNEADVRNIEELGAHNVEVNINDWKPSYKYAWMQDGDKMVYRRCRECEKKGKP